MSSAEVEQHLGGVCQIGSVNLKSDSNLASPRLQACVVNMAMIRSGAIAQDDLSGLVNLDQTIPKLGVHIETHLEEAREPAQNQALVADQEGCGLSACHAASAAGNLRRDWATRTIGDCAPR